jgi:hypothetical protein
MYGKDLNKNIRAEVGGNFEDLLMACMTDPFEYDAKNLRGAMKGGYSLACADIPCPIPCVAMDCHAEAQLTLKPLW